MEQHNILQIITELDNFDFSKLEILFSLKNFINYKISAELVLSLLLKNINELDILNKKWRLSKKENSEIFKIVENQSNTIYTEQDITKFLFLGYKKNTIANFIIANTVINRDIAKTKLIDIINSSLEYLEQKETPIFPITGLDLEKAEFTSKNQFGKLLNEGKRIFIESNYSLSKEKIIEHLKSFTTNE